MSGHISSHASVFYNHRELDGMSYAEEVLVTKSELEEKKQRMSELETQASLSVHVAASVQTRSQQVCLIMHPTRVTCLCCISGD